jgi:dipeptidyl aminopeptidase/acylaminoacyl peptidase
MASSLTTLVVGLALTLGGCGSCAGSRGTLVGARADATFVSEKGDMFVETADGIERVALDGRTRRVVFAHPTTLSSVGTRQQWHVEDTSPGLTTWALGNSDTEMFLGDMATGQVRKIEAIGKRASAASFSPDGKRVALARHSDFSHQGSKDDDTLYVVDVTTLATTTIPPGTDNWPSKIEWAADGSALWVRMNFEKPPEWVTLPTTDAPAKRMTGLSEPPAALAPRASFGARIECHAGTVVSDRWESRVRVVDGADAGTTVAYLEGRKRGFHDYAPDFSDESFTPGCGYVVFQYDRQVWAVAADGAGGPGPIVEGYRLGFAPSP